MACGILYKSMAARLVIFHENEKSFEKPWLFTPLKIVISGGVNFKPPQP